MATPPSRMLPTSLTRSVFNVVSPYPNLLLPMFDVPSAFPMLRARPYRYGCAAAAFAALAFMIAYIAFWGLAWSISRSPVKSGLY